MRTDRIRGGCRAKRPVVTNADTVAPPVRKLMPSCSCSRAATARVFRGSVPDRDRCQPPSGSDDRKVTVVVGVQASYSSTRVIIRALTTGMMGVVGARHDQHRPPD